MHLLDIHTFDQHLLNLPEACQDYKQTAFKTFQALSFPTRKQEAWRFSNHLTLPLETYTLAEKASIPVSKALYDSKRFQQLLNCNNSACFIDDKPYKISTLTPELKNQGVLWMPLEIAYTNHWDLLYTYFLNELTTLGSPKLQALHSAFSKAGMLLYVPPGIIFETTCHYWLEADQAASFPSTFIIADVGSTVNVTEYYGASENAHNGLCCSQTMIVAHAKASVSRTVFQCCGLEQAVHQTEIYHVHADATVKSTALNLGGNHSRLEAQAFIKGAKANICLQGLTIAKGTQSFDQRTLQSHQAPESTSTLLFKNALFDHTQTIFSGMIQVAEHAQKTDAYQTNRNLLLSSEAQAHSMPGLEIKANDVKCSHGAATSQFDEDILFYMLSRGISRVAAQELLTLGFFEAILCTLHRESLATLAAECIEQAMTHEPIFHNASLN